MAIKSPIPLCWECAEKLGQAYEVHKIKGGEKRCENCGKKFGLIDLYTVSMAKR